VVNAFLSIRSALNLRTISKVCDLNLNDSDAGYNILQKGISPVGGLGEPYQMHAIGMPVIGGSELKGGVIGRFSDKAHKTSRFK